MRIGYAGDRQISVDVLLYIISQGIYPQLLIISDGSTHSKELKSICRYLPDNYIIKSSNMYTDKSIKKIKDMNLDYLICIHLPHKILKSILDIVNIGVINLHPSYLPYNRGWHTSTWTLVEDTPYGATLHFMDENIDTGDVIHQKLIHKLPEDTADTLYKKSLSLELEVFKEAWSSIINNQTSRKPQIGKGTFHKKIDINQIQKLDLNNMVKVEDFINLLKGLTTNSINDAAYFEKDGVKYNIQVKILKSQQDAL